MITRFVSGMLATAVLVTVGWGCTQGTDSHPSVSGDDKGNAPVVKGAVDELPDGKGPAPFELCINTEGPVSGAVWLYAANNTAPRLNWDQWFSDFPVAAADASQEICGGLNFAVETGDTFYLNGTWANGKNFLVNNRGENGAPSDQIKEIWLDDQYYEVGKDCGYEDNNMGGYNLVCVVR
jgi:hypothetical protein